MFFTYTSMYMCFNTFHDLFHQLFLTMMHFSSQNLEPWSWQTGRKCVGARSGLRCHFEVLLVLHSVYDSNWSDAKLTFRQNLLNGLNLSRDTHLEAEVRTQACFRHTLLVLQMPPPPLTVPLFIFVLVAVIQTVDF